MSSSSKLRFFMPCFDSAIASMMRDEGHEIVMKRSQEFDALLLGGGADVHPALYGQVMMPHTHVQPRRDFIEMGAFKIAGGKPKVGICRGGQLLNVLSGGRMWQDVIGHLSSHEVQVSVPGGTEGVFKMNSTHHQMMLPVKPAQILGKARAALKVQGPAITRLYSSEAPNEWNDIEIVWYPNTKSLCFQPHPEYREGQEWGFRDLFFELIDKYIVPAAYKGK